MKEFCNKLVPVIKTVEYWPSKRKLGLISDMVGVGYISRAKGVVKVLSSYVSSTIFKP